MICTKNLGIARLWDLPTDGYSRSANTIVEEGKKAWAQDCLSRLEHMALIKDTTH